MFEPVVTVFFLFYIVHGGLTFTGKSQQLSTSDFHSFIAYAGADGTCGLASMIRPQKYKSRAVSTLKRDFFILFSL